MNTLVTDKRNKDLRFENFFSQSCLDNLEYEKNAGWQANLKLSPGTVQDSTSRSKFINVLNSEKKKYSTKN